MKKQRGEFSVELIVLMVLVAAFFGSLIASAVHQDNLRIECLKVNQWRPAVDVKLLCR